MPEAVIVGAVRTPLGRRGGKLKDWHPADLLAATLSELINRAKIDPGLVDDVITGCVSQVGEQSLNIGRNAWLAAGLPEEVPATTIDRQCGSSQQAIHFAAQGVMAGAYDLVVASGLEHMTRVPLGSSMAGGNPFPPSLSVRYEGELVPQGISAELIASRWGISREEQDDFGYRSHERAARATREGWFREHLVLVKPDGGGELLDRDEGVRMEPDRDRMRSLEPAFRSPPFEEMFPGRLGWTVTAGNSSQISDGAAGVLVASAERAEELGLRARARLMSFAVVGDDPVLMLTGPIPATRMVLDRAGLA
ncbi:MAG: thiolase family protein, partial [bacterium]